MKQIIVLFIAITLSGVVSAAGRDNAQNAGKGRAPAAAARGCDAAGATNPNCPTVDLSCEITQSGFFIKIVHLVVSNTGTGTATSIAVSGNNGYSSQIDLLEPNTFYKEEIYPGTASYSVSSPQRDTNEANNGCVI